MSDSEDDCHVPEDDANVPDSATANKLIKEFEGITNTDEIFALYTLQRNGWNLQRSLNSYFTEKVEKKRKAEQESTDQPEPKHTPGPSIEVGLREGLLTTQAPSSLTMVSWNIDGLDDKNLQKRTKAVCKILELEGADIVFLQEVLPETFSYIESKLSGYDCIAGGDGDYFIATLLRRGRVYKDESRVIEFPGTVMSRSLLSVSAHCGQVRFELLNTHLESTAEHAHERKNQLRQCWDIVKTTPPGRNVIFGGDLNMRDKELAEVGGIPGGTKDCWEACGRRKEVQYTWDMTRNSNLEWPGKFKPRCRFDRIYLRPSKTCSSAAAHFGLIGLQKISGTQSFPSDHWGLLLKLSLQQKQG